MELKSRVETLIDEYGEEWFGPHINFKPTFELGLIHIECKESDLNELAAANRAGELRWVERLVYKGDVNALLTKQNAIWLREIPCFCFSGFSGNKLGDKGAAVIARCPHLAHLKGLTIAFSGVGRRGERLAV